MTEKISIYFHVPFCTRKCDYCHFYVLPDKDPLKAKFMESLEKEWNSQVSLLEGKTVVSIYFGGGTPYLLGPTAIEKILFWVQNSLILDPEIEITLEANPENVTLESMCAYKQAGINRISIGLQTLDNPLLRTLGRIHDSNKGLESIYLAKQAGIHNISIDLMYDLPNQTLAIWKRTLDQLVSLPITHLSLYNLTIEPHTVFFKYKQKLDPLLPDPEASLAMYENARETLSTLGLHQYEISAFAKPGFHSLHNSGYWTGRPFLGFGPSAFSYWDSKRFRNVANLSKYSQLLNKGQSAIDFEERLDPEASQRELLAINLRLLEGVDLALFQSKNGILSENILTTIQELVENGFLRKVDSLVSLTETGILFYDSVAEELI